MIKKIIEKSKFFNIIFIVFLILFSILTNTNLYIYSATFIFYSLVIFITLYFVFRFIHFFIIKEDEEKKSSYFFKKIVLSIIMSIIIYNSLYQLLGMGIIYYLPTKEVEEEFYISNKKIENHHGNHYYLLLANRNRQIDINVSEIEYSRQVGDTIILEYSVDKYHLIKFIDKSKSYISTKKTLKKSRTGKKSLALPYLDSKREHWLKNSK